MENAAALLGHKDNSLSWNKASILTRLLSACDTMATSLAALNWQYQGRAIHWQYVTLCTLEDSHSKTFNGQDNLQNLWG